MRARNGLLAALADGAASLGLCSGPEGSATVTNTNFISVLGAGEQRALSSAVGLYGSRPRWRSRSRVRGAGTVTLVPGNGRVTSRGDVRATGRLSHHGAEVTARLALRVDVRAVDRGDHRQLEPYAAAIRLRSQSGHVTSSLRGRRRRRRDRHLEPSPEPLGT